MASIKLQIEKMQEVLKSKQSNDLMLKKLEALKNEINEHQAHEDGDGSEQGGRDSKNGSKLSHHVQHHEELNKTETKNKFNVDPSQHAIFNGIDRENPLLMKRYY